MVILELPLKHTILTYSLLCCADHFAWKHPNYCCYVHHYKRFQKSDLRQKSKNTLSTDLGYTRPYQHEFSLLFFKPMHCTKKSESIKMWIAIYCVKWKIKDEGNLFFARLHCHRTSNHILTGIIHSTQHYIFLSRNVKSLPPDRNAQNSLHKLQVNWWNKKQNILQERKKTFLLQIRRSSCYNTSILFWHTAAYNSWWFVTPLS